MKRELSGGINILQKLKLIEYNNDNGFADRESFRMTRQAKEMLFPELNISSTHLESFRKSLIRHEEIVRKQLHYDREVAAQVSDLERLLEDAHYREICNRLKEKGHRTGFTCLFYGAPGTGKTESVLQLARQTGRDIMQVNVQEIKSMWVGESEKNIKALFDRYRSCSGSTNPLWRRGSGYGSPCFPICRKPICGFWQENTISAAGRSRTLRGIMPLIPFYMAMLQHVWKTSWSIVRANV